MERTIEHLVDVTYEQAKNIDNMVTAITQLHGEVKQRPQKSKVLRWLVIAMAINLVIVGSMFYKVLQGQDETHQSLNNTEEVVTIIKDCLDPNGKCYSQGQANTAANRLKVICNEEKIAYVTHPGYNPDPQCDQFILEKTGITVQR